MNAIKPGIDAYFGHPSVPSSEMEPTLGGYYHPSRYSFRIELATNQYLWLADRTGHGSVFVACSVRKGGDHDVKEIRGSYSGL